MKTGTRTALIAGGVLAGTAVFTLAFWVVANSGSSSTPSPWNGQAAVVRACQDSVKKMVKDPDSARFDSWTAWPQPGSPPAGMVSDPGDVYYTASGMVNGNEPYLCDAVVTTGGAVRAQARTGT